MTQQAEPVEPAAPLAQDPFVAGLLARLRAEAPLAAAPESTYRLQFHAGFTFRDAAAIVPYLNRLGVSHCYASSYLKAKPGSAHGYDVTDHRQLNPEIGTTDEHRQWVQALRDQGMGHILDVVPNHMAVGSENAWWNDVLENGPSSPFAGYFDIAWDASPRSQLLGRVLLPILGSPYGTTLESQQVRLAYAAGIFTACYYDHLLPISPCTYDQILARNTDQLETLLPVDDPALTEFKSILTAIRNLPRFSEVDPGRIAERQREKEVIKRRLAALTQNSEVLRGFVEGNVAGLNGQADDPRSFDPLDILLDGQPYRLAYWRVAADEINYRRFFDVNQLVALNTERPEVFAAVHELVLRMLAEGQVSGLRIDHIDGLYNPAEYLARLQEQYLMARAKVLLEQQPEGISWKDVEGPLTEGVRELLREEGSRAPLYVVVEKILALGEELPERWPVHGTTGYDSLNVTNGLFVDPEGAAPFGRLYADWSSSEGSFAELVYRCKVLILRVALSSELHMLAFQADRLAQKNRDSRDFTLTSLRHAIREIVACFPVYRSYINTSDLGESDRRHVRWAVHRAKARNPALSSALFDFIEDLLLMRRFAEAEKPEEYALQAAFVGKFQQVTSPVAAKGMEDTALYVHSRLLSLNEVGGDPSRFGLTPSYVHRFLQERQRRWPLSLSAASTHDTKRSEDVRARLNVLSELPAEWGARAAHWSRLNSVHRTPLDEGFIPDANEEYFLYQTLLGVWPNPANLEEQRAALIERIQAYMQKALQEAKVHSSWVNPNPAYHAAMQRFVAQILDPAASAEFLADLEACVARVAPFGMINSLAQTLLKITAPGVPDTYQGTELWDFSLVDPDNRRPVDFGARDHALRELEARTRGLGSDWRPLARELAATIADGRIKLFVTWRGLHCRRERPGLFSRGSYQPLEVAGPGADHVFAFRRELGQRQAVTVVPRLLSRLAGAAKLPLDAKVWQDTVIQLPAEARRWHNVFTGETYPSPGQEAPTLPVGPLFQCFPVALLVADEPAAKR